MRARRSEDRMQYSVMLPWVDVQYSATCVCCRQMIVLHGAVSKPGAILALRTEGWRHRRMVGLLCPRCQEMEETDG